ncbi:MAG: amidohydrolase family protein [Dehalococcoidia bacterium]
MAKGGFKILDSDMHIMEPPDLWQRYIDAPFKDQAPRGVTSDSVRDLRIYFPDDTPAPPVRSGGLHAGHNFEKNQVLYKDHSERGWSAKVQLEAMDAEGLDAAVLYPSRGLSVLTRPNEDTKFAAAIARAYNNWLAEFCSEDSERLIGAGMISVYDINDAIAETRRVVEELGFRAVFCRSNIVNGKTWHDPYYDPLWDALEELGVPIGFHEATGSSSPQAGDQLNTNFMIKRVYAQPLTQMMGLGSFLGGGVLERHPDLHVAFLEANCSWLPWLLWRMDEGYELEADINSPELTMKPSEYFKRQVWVSIEPEEEPAKYMIDAFGADHLVFSTDYPHGDSRYPDAVKIFLESTLSDDDKRKILWDNCASFYSATAVPA